MSNEIMMLIVVNYPGGLSHELTFQLAKQFATSLMRMDLRTSIGAYEYQIGFSYQENSTELVI